jgi:hypothetical protein
VTIFEAAFRHDNFFIRADVVVKKGNAIELIEVKAKSCDFDDERGCWNKNGTISSTWEPYIADVAFQKYVVEKATGLKVTAHLMLADKTVLCATDGLNQKFRIVTRDGRKGVVVSPDLCDADLATPILRKICVDQSCDKIYGRQRPEAETRAVARVSDDASASIPDPEAASGPSDFERLLLYLADHYARDERSSPSPRASAEVVNSITAITTPISRADSASVGPRRSSGMIRTSTITLSSTFGRSRARMI